MTREEVTNLRYATEGMTKLDWAARLIAETSSSFPTGKGHIEGVKELETALRLVRHIRDVLTHRAWNQFDKMKNEDSQNESQIQGS